MSGELTPRTGNQASHTAPRNVYECRDGGFIALSGSMQSMAERIFDAIGRPELKRDPLFATNAARVRNRDELEPGDRRLPPARDVKGNPRDPRGGRGNRGPGPTTWPASSPTARKRARVITHLPDADLGTVPMHNVVPRLSGTPGGFRRPAPKLGEHTSEVLSRVGVTAADLAALKAEGIV